MKMKMQATRIYKTIQNQPLVTSHYKRPLHRNNNKMLFGRHEKRSIKFSMHRSIVFFHFPSPYFYKGSFKNDVLNEERDNAFFKGKCCTLLYVSCILIRASHWKFSTKNMGVENMPSPNIPNEKYYLEISIDSIIEFQINETCYKRIALCVVWWESLYIPSIYVWVNCRKQQKLCIIEVANSIKWREKWKKKLKFSFELWYIFLRFTMKAHGWA